MSHELRTPLNGILNFSEMMEKEMFGPIAEEYKEMAADINSSGNHLLTLLNDILDLSKMDIGKVKLREEKFSMLKEIIDAIRIISSDMKFNSNSSVKLTYNIAGDLDLFLGDRRMFKQILLNLLSNATKFTDVGEISLSLFRYEIVLRLPSS